MQELEIEAIFNAPYAPQFNPIELVFAKIALGNSIDTESLIQ